jgi:hypothetical protein
MGMGKAYFLEEPSVGAHFWTEEISKERLGGCRSLGR